MTSLELNIKLKCTGVYNWLPPPFGVYSGLLNDKSTVVYLTTPTQTLIAVGPRMVAVG